MAVEAEASFPKHAICQAKSRDKKKADEVGRISAAFACYYALLTHALRLRFGVSANATMLRCHILRERGVRGARRSIQARAQINQQAWAGVIFGVRPAEKASKHR